MDNFETIKDEETAFGEIIEDGEYAKTETASETADVEKQKRFMDEAKDRMSKVCYQISLLERITNKRSVDYSKENIEDMFAYLEKKLDDCKKTYMKKFEPPKSDFKFDFEF